MACFVDERDRGLRALREEDLEESSDGHGYYRGQSTCKPGDFEWALFVGLVGNLRSEEGIRVKLVDHEM